MKRHKIEASNLVDSIRKASKERRKLGKATLVRIIPEDGEDFSTEHNHLEQYLQKKQIASYLDIDKIGSSEDYSVDLRQVEVVYFNQ